MAIDVVMPALEMAQETGTLLAWRKSEGERVAKGEPLIEVETDKAVVEIEAPGDGVLAGVRFQPGSVVPVGKTIAWIIQPGEAVPAEGGPDSLTRASRGEANAGAAVPNLARSAPAAITAASAAPSSGRVRISPKARTLAREHGVDPAEVPGSGPEGEVLASDILEFARNRRETASGTARHPSAPLSTVARLMAERTTQSWTTVPHFFLVREVDATALNAARAQLAPEVAQLTGAKLSHTDLLIALAARVLRKHPQLNASWASDRIRSNADINVAVAVAVNDGVVAAVVHKADSLSLERIAGRRTELAEQAKAGRLSPADVSGGTFTISNLGMYGVDAFSAIIVPPQAAILAVGQIADRVVAIDGAPAVRPMCTLTLSCDHRVVDGATGALFLKDLADAIANPPAWL